MINDNGLLSNSVCFWHCKKIFELHARPATFPISVKSINCKFFHLLKREPANIRQPSELSRGKLAVIKFAFTVSAFGRVWLLFSEKASPFRWHFESWSNNSWRILPFLEPADHFLFIRPRERIFSLSNGGQWVVDFVYVSASDFSLSFSSSKSKHVRLRWYHNTCIATCTVVKRNTLLLGREGGGGATFYDVTRFVSSGLSAWEELSGNSVIFKTASSLPIFAKRVYRLPLIRRAILRRRISSRPFVNG